MIFWYVVEFDLALDKMPRVLRVQISRGIEGRRRWGWGRKVAIIVVTSGVVGP